MITGSMRPRVVITFFPERLVERVTPAGQQAALKALVEGDAHTRLAFVKREVEERGLRAQLRSGNLITGQLFVAVDRFPNAPRAKVDWSKDPLDLPVVASTVPDLEAKLTSILAKLDRLPLDAIGKELESTVTSASKLMASVDATLVPELKNTVDSANQLLGAVDHQLGVTLDEARRVLRALVVRLGDVAGVGAAGVADITSRLAAEKLGDKLGQRFVVENQPGPGGIAAARSVLSQPPDGYTLGLVTNGTSISAAIWISGMSSAVGIR